mgnify:CR=1 FL=1
MTVIKSVSGFGNFTFQSTGRTFRAALNGTRETFSINGIEVLITASTKVTSSLTFRARITTLYTIISIQVISSETNFTNFQSLVAFLTAGFTFGASSYKIATALSCHFS